MSRIARNPASVRSATGVDAFGPDIPHLK